MDGWMDVIHVCLSHTTNLIHITLHTLQYGTCCSCYRWEIGENAIDDIDDGNDNDDHDLPSVYLYLSTQLFIYLSIFHIYLSVVIHLPLSLWYSHSYDVIRYRDAIYLSIHHIYLSYQYIYMYLSYLSTYLSIYLTRRIYHIYLSIHLSYHICLSIYHIYNISLSYLAITQIHDKLSGKQWY
jgi:hypothetical protein